MNNRESSVKRTSTWEVRSSLFVALPGLETAELVSRIGAYASERGVDLVPAGTHDPDGCARTVGGTFGIEAESPGLAVDSALNFLIKACDALDIPVGEIEEIVVERGDIDPRDL
ncbi:hypothetical protein [Streptomyces malaysiensis]|uniref:hypothetical protein n=1 Tax=Streptomyces malaysiensis TaxID=92644 RepID=UPI00371BBB0E